MQWQQGDESCTQTAARTAPPRAAAASSQPQDDSPTWIKKIIGTSEYSDKFRLRRWLLFSGLVLGYSFYYLCRNSLNYVLPVMVNDKSLGLSITQLATTTSIFPLAYGAYAASLYHPDTLILVTLAVTICVILRMPEWCDLGMHPAQLHRLQLTLKVAVSSKPHQYKHP